MEQQQDRGIYGYFVLIVCLGNICRSPLAEAALREELASAGVVDQVAVDSAGTGDWNIGKPPDPRMLQAAGVTGLTLEGRARQITADDLRQADLVLVMDRTNLADVRALAPNDQTRRKVRLFLEFAGLGEIDVPDPYYGGDEGFTEVVTMVREAAKAVVERIRPSLVRTP